MVMNVTWIILALWVSIVGVFLLAFGPIHGVRKGMGLAVLPMLRGIVALVTRGEG